MTYSTFRSLALFDDEWAKSYLVRQLNARVCRSVSLAPGNHCQIAKESHGCESANEQLQKNERNKWKNQTISKDTTINAITLLNLGN